jgi:hypothetical protein
MKKIASLLLCMVLLLSVCCVNASAAENACIGAGVTVAEDGTVTVAVSAKAAAANARLTVGFDADRLTYTGCETAFAVATVKEETGKLTVGLASATAEAVAAGEELVKLTFASNDPMGTQITVTAENYGGKAVNETVALEVGVVATGWSGYTTWVLTSDGTLTFTSSGEKLENGETNLKNYWKVNGVLSLPWGEYAELITKVVVSEGIHDIGQMAFYELPNLTEVQLPSTIVEIRGYAFKNCAKLTTINLENVDFIREGAFYGCAALENVSFLTGVVIEDWAFSKTPVVLP